MNSFYHFKQALDSKQKNIAMLILRDKSESVARKIMEKAKIHVPDYKGRIFWQWVQEYIIRACAQREDKNIVYSGHRENIHRQTSQFSACTQPVGDRSDQNHCAGRNDHRPHQYGAAEFAATGTVCAGQDSISPVCSDMGHECLPGPGETSVEGAPAVDLGGGHTTDIHPDISGGRSLVRAEHTVRLCRRHAAAGTPPQRRQTWRTVRPGIADHHGLAADACQLWHSGSGPVSVPGTVVRVTGGHSAQCGGFHGSDITGDAQRGNTSHRCPFNRPGIRSYSNDASSGRRSECRRKNSDRPYAAVYASSFLLPGLCGPSHGAKPYPVFQLIRLRRLNVQPRCFHRQQTEDL